MNILWVSSKSNHRGGGSTSERTLLRYLGRTGHTVQRIAADNLNGQRLIRGPFEIRQMAVGKLLRKHIEARVRHGTTPDVIVSQGIYFPQAGDVARKFDIPHVAFVRDQFYRCPVARHNRCAQNCFQCVSTEQKLMWPLVKHLVAQKREGIDNATLILANSQYMKRDLGRRTDTPVTVLYPPIEFPNGGELDEGSHHKIVYMGGGFWKGTKLVMHLARRLPKYKFLVAGDPEVPRKWDLSKYHNVEWLSWVDRDIALESARIHLCPSYWPEPFGRIPVEAGGHGVPTIASNRGGLPEAVGPGGILLDPDDVTEWDQWTRLMMESEREWKHRSQKARDHAIQFDISRIGPQFEGCLEGVVS